jgi:hypothetical protein
LWRPPPVRIQSFGFSGRWACAFSMGGGDERQRARAILKTRLVIVGG